ncbi:MAG: serine/threonine-protein phosphatase [Butyrivibrio sp.]|nr:serine/threonine-protein phosphatase [Butyrivibrio sp.]
MKVKACIYTDVGQTRKVNQDAALVKVANTKNHGRITMIAVCDGMGGLSKGEVASCKAVRALEMWFHEELPLMQTLSGNELWTGVENSLRRLIVRINTDIRRYGKNKGLTLGTTMTLLLQIGRRYICMNIGDSRIFFIKSGKITQITKDQSVVQDKLDKGLISKEEALEDSEKNVLSQCIGMLQAPTPQVECGSFEGNTTVAACSDGFWRTISPEEMRLGLCPQMCVTDEDMLRECKKLSELAVNRNEEDNISIAAACMEF